MDNNIISNSLCTVPDRPRDVEVERVNDTHMVVRWTALSLVEARGHITNYTISYWPASNSGLVRNITVNSTTTSVLIGDLLPGEGYVVQVSANTSVGHGGMTEVTLSKAIGECIYIST